VVNHKSTIGEQALKFFEQLYGVEREVGELEVTDRAQMVLAFLLASATAAMFLLRRVVSLTNQLSVSARCVAQ
jgi:hypothetical protein